MRLGLHIETEGEGRCFKRGSFLSDFAYIISALVPLGLYAPVNALV